MKACHAFLDPGGTLVVPSLDRYGRSLQDLINRVAELRARDRLHLTAREPRHHHPRPLDQLEAPRKCGIAGTSDHSANKRSTVMLKPGG
ncbi:hypothetical protein OG943_14515 [Amycolatopsis sp. NBC_00345]